MISKNIFIIKVTDKGLAKSMITLNVIKESTQSKTKTCWVFVLIEVNYLPGCTVYLAAFIDTNYIQ